MFSSTVISQLGNLTLDIIQEIVNQKDSGSNDIDAKFEHEGKI